MTNEKASIIIGNIPVYGNECYSIAEYQEAKTLAVQALSQEQKTGHWIYDNKIQNWICSECNETPKTLGYVGTADFMKEHFKYCNHCGAKMERERNQE